MGFDPRRPDKPRLLASYHRQCVQCHLKMQLEKPKECKECHKEKQNRPATVLSQPAQGARLRGGVN